MQEPPEPVEVLDLELKLTHKVRVFNNNHIGLFYDPTNSIVSSSKYGLLFVGTPKCELNIIPLCAILQQNINGECRSFPYRVVDIPGTSSHLNINCDNTLLSVTVRKETSSIDTFFYKVESFLATDILLVHQINLAQSADIFALDSGWNPAVPNVYTVCKSDGSLDIYEFQTNGLFEKIQLPPESESRCFCWSPKGKQIAIGSRNGSITQYKPDLKAVKVIATPPLMGSMVSVQWISNYQFIGIYNSISTTEHFLIVIDAPKAGSVVYTNYEDICYSRGDNRSKQFYMHFIMEWNTLMVASSNSSEIGVLDVRDNHWTQLILPDSGRAELPLSSHNKQDTFPIGFVVDFSFKKGSLPYLILLSDEGLLCCYAIVNTKENAKSLCCQQRAPPYSDLLFKLYESIKSPKLIEDPKVAPISSQDLNRLNQSRTDVNENASATPQINQSVFGSDSVIPTKLQSTKTISKASNKELQSPFSLVSKNEGYDHEKNLQTKLVKLIKENICRLELDLNTMLYKNQCMQLITEDESANIIKLERGTKTFLSDVTESLMMQRAQIVILKQSVIQSWAWYEDVKSRRTIYSNPTTTLMRFQPLDLAFQRQLDDIYFHMYYLESQLVNGIRSLDEEWELFQMYCKESSALQLTSTEMIYRAMVKHDATLQKQAYIMKDLSTRAQSRLVKQPVPNLLVSTTLIEIENLLKNMILDSQGCEGGRNVRRLHLSLPKKMTKLSTVLESHNVIYVGNTKNSDVQLTALHTAASSSMYPVCDKQFAECANVNTTSPNTFYKKTDLSSAAIDNMNVTAKSPSEISFPSMSANQQRHILLGRHHYIKDNIVNSAFASTMSFPHRGTSDVIQLENQISNSSSSPTGTQQSGRFSKNKYPFVTAVSTASMLNNIMQQTDVQSFNNESALKPLNDFRANRVNREFFKSKSDLNQLSRNLFVPSSMQNIPEIPEYTNNANTIPNVIDNTINLLHIEGQNILKSDCQNQNNHDSKVIPVHNNFPPLRDLIQNISLDSGNTLQPMNQPNSTNNLRKSNDITSSTTFIIPSSAYSMLSVPSESCVTINKDQKKEETAFGIRPNTPTANKILSVPDITFGLSNSNIKTIQTKISLPKSEVVPSPSCAMPLVFTSSNMSNIPSSFVFQSKSGSTSQTYDSTAGSKIGTQNHFTNASNLSSSNLVATSTISNSLINTPISGPIPFIRENEYNQIETTVPINNPFPSNVTTNSYSTSEQHTNFLFGSPAQRSGLLFGDTNSNTSLNKNIFSPSALQSSAYNPSSELQYSTEKPTTMFELNNTSSNAAFGTSPATFGGFSSFGAALGGNNTFGSAPTFASTPTFAIPKLDSSGKIFGSTESDTASASQQNSTFANLANQNHIGFGNVDTSKTTSSSSFTGGSSFSNWR